MVREPVSRYVSSYLYYHFSSKKHIQNMMDRHHAQEGLMDCLEHQHEGCATNLQTKYFCGHEMFCKLGNAAALKQAKENLRTHFAVVGVLEEVDLSLQVFRAVLPSFFDGLRPDGVWLKDTNTNERSLNITAEEKQAIALANSADVELYKYAVRLLHSVAESCGLE